MKSRWVGSAVLVGAATLVACGGGEDSTASEGGAGTGNAGSNTGGSGGDLTAGTGGADTGGSGGEPVGGTGGVVGGGSGGVAGEECTYQGVGATDPRPIPLECETVEGGITFGDPPQLCVGPTHAVFLAGNCGSSAACNDPGDWVSINASVGAEFGEVVSAIATGCDAVGVEAVVELAPGATTGTLTLEGTFQGIEFCHGNTVTCTVGATTFELDVNASDCSDVSDWYCGHETGSQLHLVLGAAGGCEANPSADAYCRNLGYPPHSYFCQVPASPLSDACVIYNRIGSGDYYCCPDDYVVCPDSPPAQDAACSGTTGCSYGSHPDPGCRTRADCRDGTWRVAQPPAVCEEPLLPADCPPVASDATGNCVPDGLRCYYPGGERCYCTNCTVEDPSCNTSAPVEWRCWTPPPEPCPPFYPNVGTRCSLPADTDCRYACDRITVCNAEGVWVPNGFLCPDCNSPDTPIATPRGNRPVAELRPGDLVYSIHRGELAVVPIVSVRAKPQRHHTVVRLELASGVRLEISPGHPTADGRTLGELTAGDLLDGVRVISAARIPYQHSHTYDILPASDSDTYFAGGVLIGSTLAAPCSVASR